MVTKTPEQQACASLSEFEAALGPMTDEMLAALLWELLERVGPDEFRRVTAKANAVVAEATTPVITFQSLVEATDLLSPVELRDLLEHVQEKPELFEEFPLPESLPVLSEDFNKPIDRAKVAQLAFETQVISSNAMGVIQNHLEAALRALEAYDGRMKPCGYIPQLVLTDNEDDDFARAYWPDLFPSTKPDSY
jgi:hypothetical protein